MENNSNLPQGYKQTELGVIPEDWAIVSVDEVLDMPTKTISTTLFNHIYYVGTENMLSQKRGVSPYIGMLSYLQVREYLINDILTSNIRPYLKKIWLANKSGGCSSDVIVFRVKNNNEYYPEYIYTVLSDDAFFQYSMDNAIGTKMPRGDKNVIKAYNFVLPPLPEQKAIAEALSDVDDLITALDKIIAKKRLIKQGAMHRLIGFSETNKLQSILLRNIVNIRKGSMLTSDNFVPGNIPVIAGGKTPAGFHNIANRPEKTITISASGANAGYVALYDKPIFATDCSTIEPTSKYNIEYIYYLLKYYQNDIYTMQTGGAQPHIHPSDLNDLRILYTDNLQEQQAIATILSDMDKEIAELEAQRDKYRLVKSGMMQKLLTGEIRLRKE